jgi:DNA-binding MarR family transcriptional regulator
MKNSRSRDPLPPDIDNLNTILRMAVGRLYSRFRSERLEGELGEAAMLVLFRIQQEGPQSLSALSESARVTPGSMSQTVNRLTADGYAIRIPDPSDGRRVLFQITPKGKDLAIAARTKSIAWLEEQLGYLSQEERVVLAQAATIMRRIADS